MTAKRPRFSPIFVWEDTFEFIGTHFTLHTMAAPALLKQVNRYDLLLITLLSLGFTIILASWVYNRSRIHEQLHKQVQQRTSEIQAKQEEFSSIIDHAKESIIIADTKGLILRANVAACELFTYSPEEWCHLSVHDLVPEHIRNAHKQWMQEELHTNEHHVIGKQRSLIGRRKDGSLFHCEIAVNTFQGRYGTHMSIIVRDLTAYKHHQWTIETLLKLRSISQRQAPLNTRLEEMLKEILSEPWDITDDNGVIFIARDGQLCLTACYGWSDNDKQRCQAVKKGSCLCGKAFASGKVTFYPNRPEFHKYIHSYIVDNGYMCIPIAFTDEKLGLINLMLKPNSSIPNDFHTFCREAEEIIAELLVREKSQQKLEDSETKYRTLLENTPMGIFIHIQGSELQNSG